ncbi:MAG: HDOD domain-containing protein [Bacteroidota bacterium]
MDTGIFSNQEKREKTELVLSNVFNLPTIPSLMLEINKLLEKPQTTNTELANIIGKDQGIASKVLSIANSPFYGLPRKVSTIDFAIIIIGLQDIRNIVTALSMVEAFKNKTDRVLDYKDFWMHSIITGLAAKKIAEDLGYRSGSEAFVSGLLHDLGISIIHKYLHSVFQVICHSVENEKYSFQDAEIEALGLTHQDIGKYLGIKWNLPPAHCDTILNHHMPSQATENKLLTSVVHIADYATQVLDAGDFYWDKNYKLDESVLETCGFDNMARLEKFLGGYKELFIQETASLKF